MSRRRSAFTLLEVLAVVALTAVVLGAALRFYVTLSRGSARASERTRVLRRATAVLDLVARDYERAVYVQKPPETDPLDHPWIFYGESRRGSQASDRVKFVTRGRVPRRTALAESDLEVVAYATRSAPEEDGTLELVRWSSPELPERLDREIADDEQEGALLLASGLAGFGVTFVDELGTSVASWDSSSLVQSSELPVAVEIEVAIFDPEDPEAEPASYRRRVVLPLRPLDLAELFDPSSPVGGGSGSRSEEEEEDGEDGGVGAEPDPDCSAGPCAGLTLREATICAGDCENPGAQRLLQTSGGEPFCIWKSRLPDWLIANPACR